MKSIEVLPEANAHSGVSGISNAILVYNPCAIKEITDLGYRCRIGHNKNPSNLPIVGMLRAKILE